MTVKTVSELQIYETFTKSVVLVGVSFSCILNKTHLEPIVETTSVTQIHDGTGKLANRAKDLRGLTEKRFAEVIDGWRRQNDALKKELEMYQNQQRIGQERYQAPYTSL